MIKLILLISVQLFKIYSIYHIFNSCILLKISKHLGFTNEDEGLIEWPSIILRTGTSTFFPFKVYYKNLLHFFI